MIIEIADVLAAPRLAAFADALDAATWDDGRETAGTAAAGVKNNRQLDARSETAGRLGAAVLEALARNALFQSAALPLRISPPLFNRYEGGEAYGAHIDNAIRAGAGGPMRADLAATLFLSNPADYDGGELIVEGPSGARSVKLAAGHMILYPAGSRHRVAPVTRGLRHGCVLWVQSLVRAEADRAILFEMDASIQRLRRDAGDDHPALLALTGCYHNLLRRWSEP